MQKQLKPSVFSVVICRLKAPAQFDWHILNCLRSVIIEFLSKTA